MSIKIKINKFMILIVLSLFLTSCSSDKPSLTLLVSGEQKSIDTDIIYNSPDSVTFPVVVRSSGEKPVETEYTGVEIKNLLESYDIEYDSYDKITFSASDGYRIILSMEEIKEPNNIYLTYERDGQIMKTKKQGGNGPFQLVIRHDPFSQRWIKHVNEIIIE
jgi:hypothetical protein